MSEARATCKKAIVSPAYDESAKNERRTCATRMMRSIDCKRRTKMIRVTPQSAREAGKETHRALSRACKRRKKVSSQSCDRPDRQRDDVQRSDSQLAAPDLNDARPTQLRYPGKQRHEGPSVGLKRSTKRFVPTANVAKEETISMDAAGNGDDEKLLLNSSTTPRHWP